MESAWDRFTDTHMGVMRVESRKHHPSRQVTDRLMERHFHHRPFRWLDVGVVGMVDYERLRPKMNFTYTGVDRSQSILTDAAYYLQRQEDQLIYWNVEQAIPTFLRGQCFDCLTARHLLNHVPDVGVVFCTLAPLLAPHGLGLFTFHLPLLDGPTRLETHQCWPMGGEVIGNRWNRQEVLEQAGHCLQVERLLRVAAPSGLNDVLVVRPKLSWETLSQTVPTQALSAWQARWGWW